jgi:glyoxalase family protein
VLGLRLVKNTLNFETTFRYHMYFGDEEGRPGSVVTFLEFTDLPAGRPGAGNVFRIVLRVGSYDALEFWMDRLIAEEVHSELLRIDQARPPGLVFHDPEGHEVELLVAGGDDSPQTAAADDIPEGCRIRGIEGPRSYASIDDQAPVAEHLGFRRDRERLVLQGEHRSASWYFAPPPDRPFEPRAVGVWHHVAFDAGEALPEWRDHADAGPERFTPIFDHYFFDSCYADSPAGRIELCTSGPGFLLDESLEELGDRLCLSPRVEPLRARLERELPLVANPRPRRLGP